MPYHDRISSTFMVQLNVNKIKKELERLLEKKYTEDIDDPDSNFWEYVYELECDFNFNENPNPLTFWDWFIVNYNIGYEWDNIEKYFVDM